MKLEGGESADFLVGQRVGLDMPGAVDENHGPPGLGNQGGSLPGPRPHHEDHILDQLVLLGPTLAVVDVAGPGAPQPQALVAVEDVHQAALSIVEILLGNEFLAWEIGAVADESTEAVPAVAVVLLVLEFLEGPLAILAKFAVIQQLPAQGFESMVEPVGGFSQFSQLGAAAPTPLRSDGHLHAHGVIQRHRLDGHAGRRKHPPAATDDATVAGNHPDGDGPAPQFILEVEGGGVDGILDIEKWGDRHIFVGPVEPRGRVGLGESAKDRGVREFVQKHIEGDLQVGAANSLDDTAPNDQGSIFDDPVGSQEPTGAHRDIALLGGGGNGENRKKG